jgi:7,8-dihydropterin-6-yl-methyl-4-(beta-D-ribofuranosyl)aminobenzene 5'-phosphate synthase
MLKALDLIRVKNGNRPIPYYVHPDMFRSRARKLPSGEMLLSKDVPSIEILTDRGAQVVNTRTAQTLLDGMFHLSGEIPRVTLFERGLTGHYQRTEDGVRRWFAAALCGMPYIMTSRRKPYRSLLYSCVALQE